MSLSDNTAAVRASEPGALAEPPVASDAKGLKVAQLVTTAFCAGYDVIHMQGGLFLMSAA